MTFDPVILARVQFGLTVTFHIVQDCNADPVFQCINAKA